MVISFLFVTQAFLTGKKNFAAAKNLIYISTA